MPAAGLEACSTKGERRTADADHRHDCRCGTQDCALHGGAGVARMAACSTVSRGADTRVRLYRRDWVEEGGGSRAPRPTGMAAAGSKACPTSECLPYEASLHHKARPHARMPTVRSFASTGADGAVLLTAPLHSHLGGGRHIPVSLDRPGGVPLGVLNAPGAFNKGRTSARRCSTPAPWHRWLACIAAAALQPSAPGASAREQQPRAQPSRSVLAEGEAATGRRRGLRIFEKSNIMKLCKTCCARTRQASFKR